MEIQEHLLKEKKNYREKDFQLTLSLSTYLFSAPMFSEQMYNIPAEQHRGKDMPTGVFFLLLLKTILFPCSYVDSRLKRADLVSLFMDRFSPGVHLC